jgi:MipA family protein
LVAAARAAEPAEPAAPQAPQASLPLWEAGVGVGTLVLPAYKGSSTTRVYVAPLPYFVYRGETLRTNREGVGLKVLGAENWRLDLSLSGGLPVQSSGTKREGMRDLPLVGEVGAVLKYDLSTSASQQWQLRLPLRYATGIRLSGLQSVGWISDPGVWVTGDFSLLGARWDWGASASLDFQSGSYNNFYYGVSAAEATPTRSRYAASGGYSGADLRVGAVRRIGSLVASGFVGVSNLSGATFRDSPLVQQSTNFYAGVALVWVFDKSKEPATVINRGDMQ